MDLPQLLLIKVISTKNGTANNIIKITLVWSWTMENQSSNFCDIFNIYCHFYGARCCELIN